MSENNVKVKESDNQKKLSMHNSEVYKKPKKESQSSIKFINATGSTKVKVLRTREYSNGVKKNELVGLIKDNKVISDRGIDNKKL